MSTPLKPCPFCGDDMSSFVPDRAGCSYDGPGNLYVTCDCGAMGAGAKTVEEAIAAWNRRASAVPEGLTDQDITDLIGLAQHLQEIKHWAAQAGSKHLARLAKKLLDAKVAAAPQEKEGV